MSRVRTVSLLGLATVILLVGAAFGIVLVPESNTVTIRWVLSCSGFPVCLSFNAGSGNSTYFTYSLTLLQVQSTVLPPLYVNTTLIQAPLNVLFSVNGTAGRHWLNGPYLIKQAVPFNILYQVHYNGTAGLYGFNATVVG